MKRPLLLDLFCGAGGAAMGYYRAGFDVVGVDIKRQKNYPFDFIQGDALNPPVNLKAFDAIHASPPCQHFTRYKNAVKDITKRYADLLAPTRELLRATAKPFVIENVEGAPLNSPTTLCGSMFQLLIRRHRLFESSNMLLAPRCAHSIWTERQFKAASGRKANSRFTIEIGSYDEPLESQKRCMGIDWKIQLRELSEAIPPAYTEFIGKQLLNVLRHVS